MCRIFGSFSAGAARPDPGELAAVSARQRHGGPDEHDVLSGAGWSLGCDRLAVTDLRGGRQPYRLPHLPGIIAVLNGEIYNHRILRRELAARGHRFPDTCDGTLLPALYAEYGRPSPSGSMGCSPWPSSTCGRAPYSSWPSTPWG